MWRVHVVFLFAHGSGQNVLQRCSSGCSPWYRDVSASSLPFVKVRTGGMFNVAIHGDIARTRIEHNTHMHDRSHVGLGIDRAG